jgi:UV DNA damage endonuclease
MKATSEPQTPLKVEGVQIEDSFADTGDTRENGALNVPIDPESDEEVPVEAEELQEALSRAPPVNSSYLPLPWKGRLGYVSNPRPLPGSHRRRLIKHVSYRHV